MREDQYYHSVAKVISILMRIVKVKRLQGERHLETNRTMCEFKLLIRFVCRASGPSRDPRKAEDKFGHEEI